MKKFINRVEDVLAESLRGFEAAHGDVVRLHRDPVFLSRAAPAPEGKVALVSGGGSGHEPLHGGFVGRGMLDAACPGQVFTSPTPDQMLAAAQAVDRGAGVLFIVKNYSGDVMNFEMAVEMYEGTAATVLTNDDVAVEDSTYTTAAGGSPEPWWWRRWWARRRSRARIWRRAAHSGRASTNAPRRWASR